MLYSTHTLCRFPPRIIFRSGLNSLIHNFFSWHKCQSLRFTSLVTSWKRWCHERINSIVPGVVLTSKWCRWHLDKYQVKGIGNGFSKFGTKGLTSRHNLKKNNKNTLFVKKIINMSHKNNLIKTHNIDSIIVKTCTKRTI